MQAAHIDSSEVTVNVVGGKVTLEGTVPDRYMKHSIEDLADQCPGVQDIDNRIRVDAHVGRSSMDSSMTSGARTSIGSQGTSAYGQTTYGQTTYGQSASSGQSTSGQSASGQSGSNSPGSSSTTGSGSSASSGPGSTSGSTRRKE
jgi:hypothetical protein